MTTVDRAERQEEANLIRRVAKGDPEALELFYNKYFQRLYRYVYYRVGQDHHHTEDVVNDTFMEALDQIAKFDPARGSIDSWLITLSRNRIRSLNATLGRAREYEHSWNTLDGELAHLFEDLHQENIPEAVLESEEIKALVGAAMSSIPEHYASLLEMKYILDLSVHEIARLKQKTEKSIESQLTRARIAFREAFTMIVEKSPAMR